MRLFLFNSFHFKTISYRVRWSEIAPYICTMKKYTVYLKNKFIFTSCLFFVYILFLDDIDIFTIVNQNRKLNRLEESKMEVSKKLEITRNTLKKLRYISELESYAREEKLFKKDNEDIFILSYE